ncbi:methionine--tRNA ligase [Jiangella asiatica]|uniref:methionine--tRNA ligase n=1 Tax=Jiangella asiatica TaxID=2530372 RepID=A0A4R5CN93_9ACTN|nr:methionine--tRNA ligase [Jiangella asiatica]TDD99022.1 methionine--tRNA ligase [Jiangella asiatica]
MTTRSPDGRVYVTTAIPYVNGDPHLGHALELVQADVLARHARGRGRPVRFLTGTDDNAFKNVTAARAAGADVREFVDANAARFAGLREPLRLSYDDFIRTGTDPRHAPGVQLLWRRIAANGDLYRRRYEGLYCAGCEQFYTAGDLVDGACSEHGVAPERISEENWFFRLSRYTDSLLDALESGQVRVSPPHRRNEVLAFIRAGLSDISVSRSAERAGGWGISVPGDPTQVVYVWWEALANYVTSLGYGSGGDDVVGFRTWWAGSAERVHVIGKGIVRFHAVYWLAQLLSAGLPLPTAIAVHDYLSVDGAKISKSSGGTADPVDLVRRHGADAVRWWLVRDVAQVGDTDFTEDRLVTRHDQDLANGLGNLVHRTLGLVHRFGAGVTSAPPPRNRLVEAADALPDAVDRALEVYDLRAATGELCAVVDLGNRTVEAERPWELARRSAAGDAEAAGRLRAALATLVHACRVVAGELAPFVPDGAERLSEQLGTAGTVRQPRPVFERLRES